MSREQHRRRVKNLQQPRTLLASAFLRALRVWALRHANDDKNTIAIPTGFVTSEELRRVVCALLRTRVLGDCWRSSPEPPPAKEKFSATQS